MKRAILLFCTLLCIVTSKSQLFQISDSASISLITCSPGAEIYARFGHSAIRVNDPANKIDVVFNYGIFSFETSNFYFKFVRGETDYQLGIYETSFFLPEYKERNSTVWEQQLNLTVAEKRKLFALLMENFLPANRVYRYNFVFDNCATRPRDKIFNALDGYVHFAETKDSKTYRQWVGAYVGNESWTKFGIDLLFGLDADRSVTLSESMFLPEVLMNTFQRAEVIDRHNDERKLISRRVRLITKVETKSEPEKEFFFSRPLGLTILLLLIGVLITLWDWYNHRHTKWLDAFLHSISGLVGLLLVFMMLFSTHPLVKNNFNILWLNPLNIVFAVLMWIKNSELRRKLFFYQIFNMTMLVAALVVFALSIQSFNIASFPLIVLLLVRNTRWFAHTKHKLYKRRDLR